jgi:hypothetical protein
MMLWMKGIEKGVESVLQKKMEKKKLEIKHYL